MENKHGSNQQALASLSQYVCVQTNTISVVLGVAFMVKQGNRASWSGKIDDAQGRTKGAWG